MNTHTKTGLYWFRHDLRLHDQPALHALAQRCDQLILLYVIDPAWFNRNQYDTVSMGKFRQQFLHQSLVDLNQQLNNMGQRLFVLHGDPVESIRELVEQYQVGVIGAGNYHGFYERQQLAALAQQCGSVEVICQHNASLFDPATLPFTVDDMPNSFTPFRKRIEQNAQPILPLPPLNVLPSPPDLPAVDWDSLPLCRGVDSEFSGGETQGMLQLDYYFFATQAVAHYKTTRNGLIGWNYSSKFSAWLANGSLSVRHVYAELKRFESLHTQNESTYWLYFELLWREFFYWLQRKHDKKWFHRAGIKNTVPMTSTHSSNRQTITNWRCGQTDNVYVNACMKQLNATGFLSNRGRQWVASYLVNELACDWRYGAAYFEQQLIDHDVGANWGNWQYLAGVGSDPRNKRHFNLSKQAKMYDPEGEFLARWGE